MGLVATTIVTSTSERPIHVSVGDKVEPWAELRGTTRGAIRHYATVRSTLKSQSFVGQSGDVERECVVDSVCNSGNARIRPSDVVVWVEVKIPLLPQDLKELPKVDIREKNGENCTCRGSNSLVSHIYYRWRQGVGNFVRRGNNDYPSSTVELDAIARWVHHRLHPKRRCLCPRCGESDDGADCGNEEVYRPTSPVVIKNPPRDRRPPLYVHIL
ncbi:hypothetical protein GOBAR_AA27477 [Gossypium barbadense]|uniref:Uncharacterized protein n=1 Tax=Gossypium barbadense TaxID=3634 RepID=A0A2P5WQ49_GOSBA|nr:hypothetical protein GOBAR_AA27477 [Gossypium barbadense]